MITMTAGLCFLEQDGEMASRIRETDWAAHPLGPHEHWPEPLRIALGIALGSSFPTAVYWGSELHLLYNDAWQPVAGHRHPWAMGRPAAEVWPDIWSVVGPQFEAVLAEGQAFATYDQMLPMERDGAPAETYWNYSLSPIRDEDGRIIGVFNQGNETTAIILAERSRSVEATLLRESQERLQLALESSMSIGTWDWDVAADRVTADERFAKLYGVDPEVARDGADITTFFGAIHPEDLSQVKEAIDTTLTRGEPFIAEYRLVQQDGSLLWVTAQGRATFDASGRPVRFPGISFDITKRREAEIAARVAATDLALANEAQAFTFRLAERLRSLDGASAILRLSATTLGGRLGADRVGFYRVAPDDMAQFLTCWTSERLPPLTGTIPLADFGVTNVERYRAGETLVFDDYRTDPGLRGTRIGQLAGSGVGVPLRRGGHWAATLYANHAAPHHWSVDEVALIEAVAEITWDAVDRANAVAALRESEEKFRAIANSIDQMVWSTLPDGYHDYYNERWYDFTGVPHGSTDGEAWDGVFHPEDRPRAWAAWQHSLATGERYRIEYRLRDRTGDYRWVLGSAQPVRDEDGRITRWFGTCTDIQEIVEAREVLARSRAELEDAIVERTDQLMAAEEQLRQAHKMEAVGQLTGGIAHDFNNMLAVVIGALDLLERRVAQGRSDVGRYVEAARDGANRAAALTQRLLSFSRQSPLAPAPIDLNAMAETMIDLLSRTLGEGISVDTELGDDLWLATADRGQLENAIVNLAVNARDAMPRGGRLTIATANVPLDQGSAIAAGLTAGDYVRIAVRDTGVGMDKTVAAKAFDPFFTTKSVGKGTGLGLSQVFGFVRQSGGHITIETAPGSGTSVAILLPRDVSDIVPAPTVAAIRTARGGSRDEIVLVVEDEERVRNYSVEALRELGYTVVHASDGPSALRIIDTGQPISLLFTDVVMPEMTGRELADAASARLPGLRILYTSGYTRDAVEREGAAAHAVLGKPFDIAALAERVRATLDA